MPKAISYIRFSATHQGRGSTTERQLQMVAEWRREHPEVELSALSQEDFGRSAFKGEHLNHGLGKILEAISEKKIIAGDYILVEAVDRIGRLDVLTMFEIITKIVNSGVTIVTLEDAQEYNTQRINSDHSAIYILVGKIQQAHDYSKRLSRRLLHSYEIRREKAKEGSKIKKLNPYWLNSEGKLIERKAELVKECIGLYLKGRGTRQIILELLEKYPEISNKHPSTIKRWLSSRALTGDWETRGETISNVYEPLISKTEYYQIQREMKKRRIHMSPEQTYMLSGLVICEKCKARYYFRRKRHANGTTIYGNCSTYLKRGAEYCDNKTTWPYEVLLAILHDRTPLSLTSKVWKDNISQLSIEIDGLVEERNEISRKIENATDALVELPNTVEIKKKITALEQERKEVNQKISSIENLILDEETEEQEIRGAGKFGEVIDRTNEEVDDITSDPITLRETLKKCGFRIEGSGNTMRANLELDDWHFTKLRRSTRHQCYIVRVNTPDIQGIDEEDDSIFTEKGDEFYLAMDRQGQVASGWSEEQLMNRLESMHGAKNHDSFFMHPPQ